MAAHTPSVEEIKRKLYPHFGYHLCDFQAESIKAQLEDSDVVTIAATGAGKTAAFYGPLFFDEQGLMVINTPLNTLGKQMQKQLGHYKLETIHFHKGHTSGVDMVVIYKSNIQKNANMALRDFQQMLYASLSFPQSFSSMNDLSSCFRTRASKNGFDDSLLMKLTVYWSGKSSARNMGGQDEFATTTRMSLSMLHQPHSHHKLSMK